MTMDNERLSEKSNAQNPLDTFPRNFPRIGLPSSCKLVADLLATRQTVLSWHVKMSLTSLQQ